MQTNRTKSGNTSGSPAWLQTLVFTGSLATTVVGAGLLSQLDAAQNSPLGSNGTEVEAETLQLEPIPTLLIPPTTDGAPVNGVSANGASANGTTINLPTATPLPAGSSSPAEQNNQSSAVMPTDTPVATLAPAPTSTPVVRQQSQTSVVPRVSRRSRSSR